MNEIALLFGSIFGATAVIFGAFGAHALKKILSEDQLKNYETAVRYQMYHAIILVVLGLTSFSYNSIVEYAIIFFITGISLFSFSIYGLVISSALKKKIRILGPITPIGGLLLVSGWISLIIFFIKLKN